MSASAWSPSAGVERARRQTLLNVEEAVGGGRSARPAVDDVAGGDIAALLVDALRLLLQRSSISSGLAFVEPSTAQGRAPSSAPASAFLWRIYSHSSRWRPR